MCSVKGLIVAYPAYIREKARELRVRKNLTIDELAERLAIPRTTIYYWVRDLKIPRPKWTGEHQRLGNLAMQQKYRHLREEAYAAGAEGFSELALDPTFRDFVCMYIGEGSKRDRNVVAICNSDPAVLRLATHWIRRLTDHKLFFSLQYHADQDAESLRGFWGTELGVDPWAIRLQRKSNSNGLAARTWRSQFGVLTWE
jgi:excisionase family DNA binding protein